MVLWAGGETGHGCFVEKIVFFEVNGPVILEVLGVVTLLVQFGLVLEQFVVEDFQV